MKTRNQTPPAAVPEPRSLIDSVLLIDGDNDPHLPPDFEIGENTLVRVFLRTAAKPPRALERKLSGLPRAVTVVSPKGGGNAADFVMSLHAGMLHATLPMHVPFTLVTADRSLGVMADELQRVGRQAVVWTSHDAKGNRRKMASPPRPRSGSPRAERGLASPHPVIETPAPPQRQRGRAHHAGSPAVAARASVAPGPQMGATAPQAPLGRLSSSPVEGRHSGAPAPLAEVASAYAARLSRIKDPPSRLKTLLNDIRHRASTSRFTPEEILAELKRSHGLAVDAAGRVSLARRA